MSRCPVLIDGNPCEQPTPHGLECWAVTMTGRIITTTRAREAATSAEAVEAGARAWFDRIQSQRYGEGSKRPDGLRWQWEDITEDDRRAFRALAEPIVTAALGVVA